MTVESVLLGAGLLLLLGILAYFTVSIVRQLRSGRTTLRTALVLELLFVLLVVVLVIIGIVELLGRLGQ